MTKRITRPPKRIGRPPVDPTLRFQSKTEAQPNGCRYWTGGLDKDGYGKFWDGVRHLRAHRYAFELANGREAALTVDHVCHNRDLSCAGGPTCLHRRCVEPTHLIDATVQENSLAGRGLPAVNAAKTHCLKGHPLSGDNLYVTPKGGRGCGICRYETNSAWQRENRDLINERKRASRQRRRKT